MSQNSKLLNGTITSGLWPEKTTLLLLSLALLIPLAGIVYEWIGERIDAKKHAPAGRLITVNGHSMHIFSKGNGSATVVCASGWAIPSPYVDLYPLWNEMSKRTRTVVYDRPGYGWSEVTDAPRDIDTITREVHQLLENAGEKPPYVLVGHSIGSLEVIRFTQMYPDEVKGVILIDGSNPDMYAGKAAVKPPFFLSLRITLRNWGIWLANRLGLTRLLFNFGFYTATPLSTARKGLLLAPPDFKLLDGAMFLRTFNNKNQVDEAENKKTNASTVSSHGHLNIPLIIVTSQELQSYPDAWKNQIGLRNWSVTSRQVVVNGAGHAVHWWRPETVNREIQEILGIRTP